MLRAHNRVNVFGRVTSYMLRAKKRLKFEFYLLMTSFACLRNRCNLNTAYLNFNVDTLKSHMFFYDLENRFIFFFLFQYNALLLFNDCVPKIRSIWRREKWNRKYWTVDIIEALLNESYERSLIQWMLYVFKIKSYKCYVCTSQQFFFFFQIKFDIEI